MGRHKPTGRPIGRPREPIVHGTNAGYQKEHDRGLPKCAECRAARRAYENGYRARRAVARRAVELAAARQAAEAAE